MVLKIVFPMLSIIDNKNVDKKNIREVLVKMIDSYIKTHTIPPQTHPRVRKWRYVTGCGISFLLVFLLHHSVQVQGK